MKLTNEVASDVVDYAADKLNGGALVIYDDDVVLVSVALPTPPFVRAVNGLALGNELPPTTIAANGHATHARLHTASGETFADLTVGLEGAKTRPDIVLERSDFQSGGIFRPKSIPALRMPRSL